MKISANVKYNCDSCNVEQLKEIIYYIRYMARTAPWDSKKYWKEYKECYDYLRRKHPNKCKLLFK